MQRINSLRHNTYCMLLFFDGDYENVIRMGLSEKNALGWSSTFMKEGLALFLLLLYKGKSLPKGLEFMLKKVISGCDFNVDMFLAGTGLDNVTNEFDLLWDLFCKWKEETSVTEEEYSKWINMIERYISMRTDGIMDGNHRNY